MTMIGAPDTVAGASAANQVALTPKPETPLEHRGGAAAVSETESGIPIPEGASIPSPVTGNPLKTHAHVPTELDIRIQHLQQQAELAEARASKTAPEPSAPRIEVVTGGDSPLDRPAGSSEAITDGVTTIRHIQDGGGEQMDVQR